MSERSIRLQKFIADCGTCSRRKAEDLIVQGRVKVNELVITQLGTKVNPDNDVVVVDGQILDVNAVEKMYLVMNKPRGYVTTLDDPEGRKTVMDFVKLIPERIYPVGRLDYLSEGLLIMTNDGDVANLIMHPRYEVIKVYEVKVFGAVDDNILKSLRDGTTFEGHKIKPLSCRVVNQLQNKTWLEFRLGEGRNREIRRICEDAGVTVDKLKRTAIGALTVDGIAPGKFHMLSKKQLLQALGMNEDGSSNGTKIEYFSSKKTINVKKRGAQPATLATDKEFAKFRKDVYFKTVTELKDSKKHQEKEERRAHFEEKEERHQKRKQSKLKRMLDKKNGQKTKVNKKFKK